jgi:serine/threonine protein kinase
MELVSGTVLSECIPEDGFPVASALHYARQICSALAHAHGNGVVHRDIKPSNLMITGDDRAKMLDFGLARRVNGTCDGAGFSRESLTQNGAILGTFHYMAPEALRGERIDARGDVWSFGILLHELLTGRSPWEGKSGFALSAAILTEPLPPCPAHVPGSLRAVMERCLKKDPGQRFADAGDLEQALRAAEIAPDRPRVLRRMLSARWLAFLVGVTLAQSASPG